MSVRGDVSMVAVIGTHESDVIDHSDDEFSPDGVDPDHERVVHDLHVRQELSCGMKESRQSASRVEGVCPM